LTRDLDRVRQRSAGGPHPVNVMGSIVFAVGVIFAIVNSVVSRRRAA
jgi:hypothetical protein